MPPKKKATPKKTRPKKSKKPVASLKSPGQKKSRAVSKSKTVNTSIVIKDYGLTQKEILFCLRYLEEYDAATAYLEYIGSKKLGKNTLTMVTREAHTFMQRPAIREFLREHFDNYVATVKDHLMARILEVYTARAFYNPFDFIDLNGDFLANVDMEEAGKVVQHIERRPFSPHGKGGPVVFSTKVIFVDRDKALETLSRYIGLLEVYKSDMEKAREDAITKESGPRNLIAQELKAMREGLEREAEEEKEG